MAWRIDEQLIRGEIDNRTRGRVTGRLWFTGVAEPVVLELAGNAWRDLAGRLLEFSNPDPKPFAPPGLRGFPLLQRGTTGDITASRKVRVPDIPMDQIGEYYAAKKPFPWHWGNSLYLEWFSDTNGRVVIESASYTLAIAPDSTWEMTPAEEEDQRRANAAGMTGFLDAATQALAEAQAAGEFTVEDLSTDDLVLPPDLDDDGDADADAANADENPDEENANASDPNAAGASSAARDSAVPTEEEAERRQARSERLIDRIVARIAENGTAADLARIVAEEIERARIERGEPPLTPDEKATRAAWIEDITRAARDEAATTSPDETIGDIEDDDDEEDDPAFEDSDDASFEDDDDDDDDDSAKHPLSVRVYTLVLRVLADIDTRGWGPATDAGPEDPIIVLSASLTSAGAKFAGALDGGDWPPPLTLCADTIVRLKRALSFLDDARLALESCRDEGRAEPTWLATVADEVAALTAAAEQLVADLRARLAGDR